MNHKVQRALVSVYDKTGVVDFCKQLTKAGVEILSSGGTARLLSEHGVDVVKVADYTGSPEILDGRVKTLHPKIHGGILAARDLESHMADLEKEGIKTIDLVVVNLYPFEQTVATAGVSHGEVVEMIDIGGPTMVRAAAKNHAHVGVVVNPSDYGPIADELQADGGLGETTRRKLAATAFRHTSGYDLAVQTYLERPQNDDSKPEEDAFDERLVVEYSKLQGLRYGENPHQQAAFYRDPLPSAGSLADATQLQGKELSFNNILDFDAALGAALELPRSGCVIVKHGNPCGVALGTDPAEAFERALACDPTSAFGGVIAFNRTVDGRAAKSIRQQFYEGVVAPRFDDEAKATLARKKKLRCLELGDIKHATRGGMDLRRVNGGLLAQTWDRIEESVRESRVVSRRAPTEDEWKALEFGWVVAKHVKSNAIVYARADRTIGIGAGQMSRVDSARLGADKANTPLEGCAMASDAFFPFRDGIDVAAKVGVRAVVQPGGSIRDDEVIAAADEHDVAMVFTGRRHFRH
ncbi:MAG: bifunctional phosphoribosylaminoimidazolecarboxamide formyltransferase/IMP cyclohydrolase [Acidobacteriota bacterium]|nr:bifunctional phosphoribosylaminoimidazolecarboxamide formyltransferase/IMP cyclohydrolase [Acidobacteriota bacterium]MDH3785146.1 bifunctional phosphoribosylaminoimidazolecarboxamide formyltransferase/IMP cyclohydrolase [Acidobacteriota bacterium]